MNRDKATMKSILENARALRTASLNARKKPDNETSSPRPLQNLKESQHQVSYTSLPNIQSQAIPHHISRNNNGMSYQFSQPDINQSRQHMESMYRNYYDNESMQLSNMSQINDSIYLPKTEYFQPKADHKTETIMQIFSKVNEYLLGYTKEPNKMIMIQQKIQAKIRELQPKERSNIVKLVQDFD